MAKPAFTLVRTIYVLPYLCTRFNPSILRRTAAFHRTIPYFNRRATGATNMALGHGVRRQRWRSIEVIHESCCCVSSWRSTFSLYEVSIYLDLEWFRLSDKRPVLT